MKEPKGVTKLWRSSDPAAKEEPIRQSTGTAAIAAFLVLILNKFGIAEFSLEEGVIIVGGVIALANETARMRVWAAPKNNSGN